MLCIVWETIAASLSTTNSKPSALISFTVSSFFIFSDSCLHTHPKTLLNANGQLVWKKRKRLLKDSSFIFIFFVWSVIMDTGLDPQTLPYYGPNYSDQNIITGPRNWTRFGANSHFFCWSVLKTYTCLVECSNWSSIDVFKFIVVLNIVI